MAAKKLYALTNVSTPDGVVRPGDEVLGDLNKEAREVLLRDGDVTEDADLAASVAAASVAAPSWGTTTGGIEVVEAELPLAPPLPTE